MGYLVHDITRRFILDRSGVKTFDVTGSLAKKIGSGNFDRIIQGGFKKELTPYIQSTKSVIEPHKKTGKLKKALTVKKLSGGGVVAGQKYGSGGAPHAHLFEDGTRIRRRVLTGQGFSGMWEGEQGKKLPFGTTRDDGGALASKVFTKMTDKWSPIVRKRTTDFVQNELEKRIDLAIKRR